MSKLRALISENTIVLHYKNQKINIQKDTDNLLFEEIKVLIEAEDEAALIERFADVKARMERYTGGVVTVINGKAHLKGDETEIPQAILSKLVDMEKTSEDFLPLIRFWRKLKDNPNPASREDLYGFMLANNVPLTEQGDIVVEKGVSQKKGSFPGHLVDGHSGSVNNTVGMTVQMPRANVNDNNQHTCSTGLHVAAPDFVRNHWSQPIIIECVVNPMDVCAVPIDYKNTKMRVCKYVVMGYSPKSGRTDKVMKLSDFIVNPTQEVQQKLISGVKGGQSESKQLGQKDQVKSLPTPIKAIESTKYSDQIEGMTAKQMIDYVVQKTGETITLSLKNKAGITKRAMTILEAHDISKQIEQKNAPKVKVKKALTVEKGPWNLVITQIGPTKLAVVALVKELTGKGLKESKDLIDTNTPVIFTGASKRFVEKHRAAFEELGVKVELSKGEIVKEIRIKVIELTTLGAKDLRALAKSKFNEVFPSRDTKQMVLDKVTALFTKAGYQIK